MLDHIGTNKMTIRRNSQGVLITQERINFSMSLDGDEWLDLIALVLAVKTVADFSGELVDA